MPCPVCNDPTGVRCCEFGADRPTTNPNPNPNIERTSSMTTQTTERATRTLLPIAAVVLGLIALAPAPASAAVIELHPRYGAPATFRSARPLPFGQVVGLVRITANGRDLIYGEGDGKDHAYMYGHGVAVHIATELGDRWTITAASVVKRRIVVRIVYHLSPPPPRVVIKRS